jgi:hypothetical protein
MVGARLPDTVVRDLDAIERVEQADRSTTPLSCNRGWKLDHYSLLYGSGKITARQPPFGGPKEGGIRNRLGRR